MRHDPLITHAAHRGLVGLHDGTTVALIAVPTRTDRNGRRHARGHKHVRVQYPNGRLRTIPRTDIAHIYPLEVPA